MIKPTLILLLGTAASQLVAIASLPVLTRFFSPADFDLLAGVASAIAVYGAVAALRYEVAILLPGPVVRSASLFWLSAVTALAISTFTAAVFVCISLFTEVSVGEGGSAIVVIAVLGGLFFSLNLSSINWMLRQRRYGDVALAKFGQVIAGVAFQLFAGLLMLPGTYLVIGHCIGVAGGSIYLAIKSFIKDRKVFKRLRLRGLKAAAWRCRRYPKYSTIEALLNAGSNHGPVLLIAALANAGEAGYVFIAMKVVGAPVQLVGGIIGQVYFSRAGEFHATGTLFRSTMWLIGVLFLVGLAALVVVGMISEPAIEMMFGEGWGRVSDHVIAFTPWFLAQFITSPVSMSLHVLDRQKAAMWLQLFGFTLRFGSVLVTGLFAPIYVSTAFAVSGLIFYVAYLGVIVLALCKYGRLVK